MGGQVDRYSDDAPRSDPQDDALGIAPFAERLAELLIALEAQNGYVVGLSGEWGSGKTTAINFVKNSINKLAPQREGESASITMLDFRPWLFSGHEDLIGSFFKVLAERLGSAPPRWKKLAAGAAHLGTDLSGALSKIGVLTAHLDAGAVMMGGATIGKALSSLAKRWSAEPSLQSVYDELRDILSHSATKIVIFIDDVDRLQTNEIRAMMTLVKTVGQLPNVVYLLSYDRNLVWPALQGHSLEAPRRNFAEKLVQQEVSVPPPGFDRLYAMLKSEILFLQIAPEDKRWDELGEIALRRWLRTPRDVLRLANNMRFAWPALQDFIDPVDYVAIEGARTFDKALFDWIRDSPFIIFGQRRHSYDPERPYNEAKTLKEKLCPSEIWSIFELIKFLFPHIHQFFIHNSSEEAKESRKYLVYTNDDVAVDRQSLSRAAAYDSYFRLHVSNELVGRAFLLEFFSNIDDENYLYRALIGGTEISASRIYYSTFPLFEAVAARLKSLGFYASPALLSASFDVYKKLCDDNSDGKSWDAQRAGYRFFQSVAASTSIIDVIACLSSKEDINELYAFTLIAEAVRRREARLSLTEEDRSLILNLARLRIQSAADENRLNQLHSLHAAIMLWVSDQDFSIPRAWLANNLSEPWLLPRLRYFFEEVMEPISLREGRYAIGTLIPRFFDLDQLQVAVQKLIAAGDGNRDIWVTLSRSVDAALAERDVADTIARLPSPS